MTTIAWSKKFGIMAGDKMAHSGHNKHSVVTKIFKVRDHLIGFSGSLDVAVAVLKWFEGGCNESDWPDLQYEELECSILVITPEGQIHLYERYPTPIVLEQGVHAIGSGADFAMAALHLGHDPVKAVEVASALDSYTGSGIDVLYLDESKLQ